MADVERDERAVPAEATGPALHLLDGDVQAELVELAAIVESSEDAILSKNLDGTIRSWNRGAERLYGYTREDAVGRHISMLAPPDRADEIMMIIERIRHGERVEHFETLRRRKDGRDVYVSLTVSPVRSRDGTIIAASVIARDLSKRHEVELALHESERKLQAALVEARLSFETAETARHEAEVLSQQMEDIRVIVDVTLARTSLDDLLHALLDHVHGRLSSDATMILLVSEHQRFEQRVALGLVDGSTQATFSTVGQSLVHRIVERHEPIVLQDTSGLGKPGRGTGVRSVAGVPLVVQGQLIGVLCVGSGEPRAFTRAEVQLLQLTADRAAVAIDNARLFERTQSVAESLQRSLLPKRLPTSRAADIAVRYLPAVHGMQVGGDWYDAAELAGDKLALMIGDVAGHGIEAAAAMGQVRNVLRALALDGHGPAGALERLNRIHALEDAVMVTVAYLIFDAGTLSARFASAGHPPPLLVHPNRSAELLEGGRSVPLGAPSGEYEEREVELEPESTILLYTDGLIERRDVSLDVGFERLVEAASGATGDVEEFASHVVSTMVGNERGRDDVALIALRVRSMA